MLDHEGCQLRVQVVEKDDITITHLIEHADQMTFAKGCSLGSFHRGNIGDVAIVTNGIVINEVTNLLYQTVIAHGNIAEGGIIDTSMLGEALGDLYLILKLTQANVAIEYHAVETIRSKGLIDHHIVPILGPAAIALEHVDFLLIQMSVISHK